MREMRTFLKDLTDRRKEIGRKNLESLASVQQSLKQIIKEEIDFVKSLKDDVLPIKGSGPMEAKVEADEVIEDTWK
jgi:hypothetical protein